MRSRDVQSPPKHNVFRFHVPILSFGEPGSLWKADFCILLLCSRHSFLGYLGILVSLEARTLLPLRFAAVGLRTRVREKSGPKTCARV